MWNSKQECQNGDWEEEYWVRDFYKRKYTKSIFLGFPNNGQTFQINIGNTLKSSLADMPMASTVKEGFDQKHKSLGTLIDGRRTWWFFPFLCLYIKTYSWWRVSSIKLCYFVFDIFLKSKQNIIKLYYLFKIKRWKNSSSCKKIF